MFQNAGATYELSGEAFDFVYGEPLNVTDLEVGDPVLAVAPASFARFAVTNADLVVPKAASLSFEEAATIPITFLTAHYALGHRTDQQAGDTRTAVRRHHD